MYLNRILICKFCFYFACLISVAFSDGDSIETWIGADDLHKIDINMTTESVRGVLGDPLFIESALDDDIVITKYIYSFRTKEYNKEELGNNGKNQSGLAYSWGRNTNIQFVFDDDLLVAWEEDKLTLSQTVKLSNGDKSIFGILNILLNIVVITLNAAVLMGS